MSNRLLWILIILWFLGAIVIFYLYFFVYYTSTLLCSAKVSPFSYTLTANSNGYKQIRQDITVPAGNTLEVNLDFEKDVVLVPQELSTSTASWWIEGLTQIQKVDLVKRKKTAYAFIEIPSLWYFEFDEVWGKLQLNYLQKIDSPAKNLGSFEKASKDSIQVKPVYENQNQIYLHIWTESFIIDKETDQIYSFKLSPEVLYIKKGESNFSFLIVTKVGTYVYDTRKEVPEYFTNFTDFIISSDQKSLIGYISSKDTLRRTNFGITDETNVIIEFNREALDKKILLKTGKDIVKMYHSGTWVIVETDDGETLNLNGL